MAKEPKCTICGGAHYQTFCHQKRKPIKKKYLIEQAGEHLRSIEQSQNIIRSHIAKAKEFKPSEVINKKLYIKVSPKIKPVSDSQKRKLARYRVVRDEYMKAHPSCEAKLDACTYKATDLHHKAGRTGNLLTDTRYFCALCRNCHVYLETHVDFAKEKGFSLDRLDK